MARPRFNPRRLGGVLSGVWVGLMVGTALIGTPAGFALAPRDVAGKLAGFMLEREATVSLVIGAVMLILVRALARDDSATSGRSLMSTELLCVMGALFCTLMGHYGLQPWIAAARTGQGALSFGVLHGISVAFFGVKALLVLTLAWRLSAPTPSSAQA